MEALIHNIAFVIKAKTFTNLLSVVFFCFAYISYTSVNRLWLYIIQIVLIVSQFLIVKVYKFIVASIL